MDDILKRLGTVESSVFSIAGDVREIKGVLQSLATKSEVEKVRVEVQAVRTDLGTEIQKVRTEIAMYASSVIKWLVGTMIASTTLAFAAARLFH